MASTDIVVTLHCRLPFWWRAYLRAVCMLDDVGLIETDPEVAIAFILRHTRFYTVQKNGRRRRWR